MAVFDTPRCQFYTVCLQSSYYYTRPNVVGFCLEVVSTTDQCGNIPVMYISLQNLTCLWNVPYLTVYLTVYRHFFDFQQRIPRSEMVQLQDIAFSHIRSVDPQFIATVCGSFRRGTLCGVSVWVGGLPYFLKVAFFGNYLYWAVI